MKLLFFSTSLAGGGAERVLANLSSALSKLGHEVIVSINEDRRFYSIDEKVKIIVAPQRRWYSGNNPLFRLIRRVLRNFRDSRHTRNVITTTKPDIIVSFLQCNMSAIIRWHKGIPIINSEHNAYDRKLGLKNYYHRFVLNRFFDKVCVLSTFDIGYASAKMLKNVIYIPNPNTYDSISDVEYNKLFPNRKNILICGRLDAWYVKGFDIAIKVFGKIANIHPSLYLDIVGGGSDDSIEILNKIASKYGVKDRVRFLGQCANMSELYRTHQIFLLTSRTEGFPMVVSEAMSQGLPCISFERLSSHIIIDGRDGILIPNRDENEMLQALLYILTNDTVRYNYGLEGVHNIGRFSPDRVAQMWIKLFNSVVE